MNMKQKLFIVFFVVGITTIHAQSNYYLGYQNGFKYGCQCYDTPTKNVAYVSGSYDDGYRDGKLDGVIYTQKKSSNSNNQNNQNYDRYKPHDYNNAPVYTPNYELTEKALQQKQTLLNQRMANIKGAFDNLNEIMLAVKTRNNGFTAAQLEYGKWLIEQVNLVYTYDFTVESNYINVMNWIQKVKETVLKW